MMSFISHVPCFLLLVIHLAFCSDDVYTNKPLIGILTQPCIYSPETADNLCYGFNTQKNFPKNATPTSYLPASYVKWIESAGGTVIPIRYDMNATAMKQLITHNLNGILLTGGVTEYPWMTYQKLVNTIIHDYTNNFYVNITNKTQSIPIFGTCEGYENIISAFAKYPYTILSNVDSLDISLAIDWQMQLKQLWGMSYINMFLPCKKKHNSIKTFHRIFQSVI